MDTAITAIRHTDFSIFSSEKIVIIIIKKKAESFGFMYVQCNNFLEWIVLS